MLVFPFPLANLQELNKLMHAKGTSVTAKIYVCMRRHWVMEHRLAWHFYPAD